MWRRPLRTKGRRRKCASLSHSLSARQPEHQKESAVELFGCIGVDSANNPPNAVAAECDQLICHDLRSETKAVFGRDLDYRSERKSVLQV